MDQSGPWTKSVDLIIDRPEAQPPLQRAAFGVVTLVFWLVWFYLMMPLVTLLGWAFGVVRFVDVMIGQGGALAVVRLIGWYLLIIALLSGALIGWALYNWARFRNATRRSNASQPVTDACVAAYLGVAERSLAACQQARMLDVEFDDHGHFLGVAPVARAAKPLSDAAVLG